MTFPANIDQLHSILDWVKGQVAPMQFDKKALRNIELAVEEAVVNVINHGYKNGPGKIQIHVHLFAGHVEIEIADTGPPFNPLEYSGEIDRSQIGGLGIHMMKQCVDSVEYQRIGNRNLLILKKIVVG